MTLNFPADQPSSPSQSPSPTFEYIVEPAAAILSGNSIDTAESLLSIAISLKRIADICEQALDLDAEAQAQAQANRKEKR